MLITNVSRSTVPDIWLMWLLASGACLMFVLGFSKLYDIVATVWATQKLRRERDASLDRQQRREQQLKAIVQGRR